MIAFGAGRRTRADEKRRIHIQTLQVVIPIAVLVTLILATAAFLLLRTFFATCSSYVETLDPLDFSWKDYRPLVRLLDPADFEYLRRRGVAEPRIKKLRVERRQIYRLCLRSLAHDFNRVHRRVNFMMIHSHVDRPELAKELAQQKMTFYRNLLRVEFRLTLNAFGIERMPEIDLLQPLVALEAELRRLTICGAAA